MDERTRELLDRLARRYDVAAGYHDIWGAYHPATPEAERAILRAMGLEVDTAADLEAELARREERDAAGPVEPFTLLPEGEPQRLRVRAPAGPPGDAGEVTVSLSDRPPRRLVPTAEGEVTLTDPLPVGLHEARVETGAGATASTLLAVCPRRGHEPEAVTLGGRLWGVNLPLYGVRSERDWGVGDFADLLAAVDWAADLGADLLGLLPLHALPNEPPFGVSPYFPSSRLFLNPLYIAVDRVPEAAHPEVRAFLDREETRRERTRLREAEEVDYRGAWALKRAALDRCYRAFAAEERRAAFTAWRREQGRALEDFATFEALRDRLRDAGTWRDWPAGLRSPTSPEVAAFRAEHEEQVGFHAWLQWVAETQLAAAARRARARGMAVGLYLDVALGVDPCGADAWVYQEVLARGASAGAPPDPFSLLGQRWGVPPTVPERHRQSGYQFFRETVRRTARRAGALRIDHVLALWRLFWVPDPLPAADGAYVTDRADELLGLLRLVSREEACLVVGEDLGTVPPEVREELMDSGFLSYRLLLFEKDDGGRFRRPADLPRQALVSFATHDLPTLDGFWQGRDLEVKRDLDRYPDEAAARADAESRERDREGLLAALRDEGLLPEGVPAAGPVPQDRWDELAAAVHAYLARAPSALLLANLDDLVGGVEMQNLPGTLDEHPNWRRRCRQPLERWSGSQRAHGIAAAIRREGRGPAR